MIAGIDLRWSEVPPGADRRAVADGLLTSSLRDRGEPTATIVRACARCGGGDHGAVRVRGAVVGGVAASVSYAGGLALVATVPRPGGDAELFAIDAAELALEPAATARLRAVLGDDRADAATWTRVEAALKADGRGLRLDPALVRLSLAETDDGAPAGWWARVPGRPHPLRVVTLAGPPGLAVSAALSVPGAAVPAARARRATA